MHACMKGAMINDCTFIGETSIKCLPCRSEEMI
jgi:hypothetical protein